MPDASLCQMWPLAQKMMIGHNGKRRDPILIGLHSLIFVSRERGGLIILSSLVWIILGDG